MVYIKRSENDEILEIEFTQKEGFEEISLHDPNLSRYIENSSDSEEIIQKVLARMDLDMVRVIEDVIDILIDKNLMLFTDLPDPVQNKILFKKSIRNISSNKSSILHDQEILDY